jgi:hypothetical protein
LFQGTAPDKRKGGGEIMGSQIVGREAQHATPTQRHWTKHRVRRHPRLLVARLGHWPSRVEYSELSALDEVLPPVEDVLRTYGSWSAARAAVSASERVSNLQALHRPYMSGTSPHELAKRVGVSHDTVLIEFKEAGLRIRAPSKWPTLHRERADREHKSKVVRTFKKTRSITEAAQATGTTYARLSRVLSRKREYQWRHTHRGANTRPAALGD